MLHTHLSECPTGFCILRRQRLCFVFVYLPLIASKCLIHIELNGCILENIIMYLHMWLSGKESACQVGDTDLIPGSGRFPGEGNDHPLQYSCLGFPWTEEPGRPHSMDHKRFKQDLLTKQQRLYMHISLSTYLSSKELTAH